MHRSPKTNVTSAIIHIWPNLTVCCSKQGSQLCFQCHDTFEANVFRKKVVHQPVAEGQCSACHEPHASATSGLLKRSMSELCLTCHNDIDEQPGKSHAPFAKGQCATCHLPHSGDRRALLKADNSAVCLSCHQSSPALRRQHLNRSLDGVDCLECHQPHKSQQVSLLRENLHQPFCRGQVSELPLTQQRSEFVSELS